MPRSISPTTGGAPQSDGGKTTGQNLGFGWSNSKATEKNSGEVSSTRTTRQFCCTLLCGFTSRMELTYFDIVDDARIVYTYEMYLDGNKMSVSVASIALRIKLRNTCKSWSRTPITAGRSVGTLVSTVSAICSARGTSTCG